MTAFAACQISFAYSQTVDSAKTPLVNIPGSADVYYKYNFNGNNIDNKTSFTNSQNSFELGMFSLKVEHSFNNGSIVADLGFGRRAAEFSYNDHPGDNGSMEMVVKQLYLSYQALDKLRISMGSFATHVGYAGWTRIHGIYSIIMMAQQSILCQMDWWPQPIIFKGCMPSDLFYILCTKSDACYSLPR